MEKQKNYLLLVLKGCAMGAADVVPGVSGGTIAFITGIYEELIDSIKSIDLQALKLLLSLKFADFWKKITGHSYSEWSVVSPSLSSLWPNS